MNNLTNNELANIYGGALSKTILGGIVLGAIFIVSVIYGFINPNKCN